MGQVSHSPLDQPRLLTAGIRTTGILTCVIDVELVYSLWQPPGLVCGYSPEALAARALRTPRLMNLQGGQG
jgi:hypothetical protein